MRELSWRAPILPIAIILGMFAVLAFAFAEYWPEISAWAREQQRGLQSGLARGVNAVRTGDAMAIWGLLGACAAYGVVHAIGPGHGKLLIGGAAVATRRTATRMAQIALAASLMQAVTAIVLVYGGLGLATVSSAWVLGTTERILAPLSFAAMALVGLWIAWRGVRILARLWRRGDGAEAMVHAGSNAGADTGKADHIHIDARQHDDHRHHSDGACDAGCKHLPSAQEAENAGSWREVAALIASIGIRPCSGALIVLVIAWKFGLYLVGAASAVAMALGTGAIVAGVALAATTLSSVGRISARAGDRDAQGLSQLQVLGGLQVCAGLFVAVVCVGFMMASLETPSSAGLLR